MTIHDEDYDLSDYVRDGDGLVTTTLPGPIGEPIGPDPGAIEAVTAGLDVVLAAVLDVTEKVDAIARKIDALEAEVRPLVEAAKQLGPMAEKMAQGGLMGLLRPQ